MESQSGSVADVLALYTVESVNGKYSAALNRWNFAKDLEVQAFFICSAVAGPPFASCVRKDCRILA